MSCACGWKTKGSGGQVEDQDFGVTTGRQREARCFANLQGITRRQVLPVDGKRAAHEVDIGDAAIVQIELGLLGAVEEAGVELRVGMDADRALRAVVGRDQA